MGVGAGNDPLFSGFLELDPGGKIISVNGPPFDRYHPMTTVSLKAA